MAYCVKLCLINFVLCEIAASCCVKIGAQRRVARSFVAFMRVFVKLCKVNGVLWETETTINFLGDKFLICYWAFCKWPKSDNIMKGRRFWAAKISITTSHIHKYETNHHIMHCASTSVIKFRSTRFLSSDSNPL